MKSMTCFILLILTSTIFAQEINVYSVMGEGSPLSDGISIDEFGNMFICDAVGDGSSQNPQGSIVIKLNQYLEMSIYATGMQIPIGNCLDEEGNLYVSNLNGYLKKVSPDGSVSDFGNLFCCLGLEFDSAGNLYVAMPNSEGYVNNHIKKITPQGEVTTIYSGEPLYFVYGLAIDENDILYAGNFSNGEIYSFDLINGNEPFLVGTIPDAVWGCAGFMDYYDGNLYIGGYWNRVVYKMNTSSGETVVLAGTGEEGMENGPAHLASFYKPNGIEVVEEGDDLEIFVTDDGNKSLRKIVISNYTDSNDNTLVVNERSNISNYPNPFNPSTTITFNTSEEDQDVEIFIYNIKGELIRSYIMGNILHSGSHNIVWDGKDLNNNHVSSGIYLYSFKINNILIETKRCLLLK